MFFLGFLAACHHYVDLSEFKDEEAIFSVVSCWFLLVVFIATGSADIVSNRTKLEQITARIDRAEADLRNKKKSELNLSRELALLNRTLQQVKKEVGIAVAEQKKIRKKIGKQKSAVRASERSVKAIGKRLKNRLVALYKEGEAGALKVIFSSDSPTQMVQQYHYLTKVLEYDRELLAEFRQAITEQQQQLEQLKKLEQEKALLVKKQQDQQLIAETGRKLQARLLRQAQKDKARLAAEVKQLKRNAARLKKLISDLEQQAEAVNLPVAESFAVGKGKLGWPVTGRVSIGFGKQKDSKLGTYYDSNGIEIIVPVGSPIRAVAAGKIVFADYFKGYGNLYIISHPGGYHTLYAQTDQMSKQLNEQVAAGDLLGRSGLGGRDNIYFEIRSKGSPVNPLSWLIKR